MIHNCSVAYNFSATDCGDCPTIINSTSANCLLQRLKLSQEHTCTVSVNTVVCEDFHGEQSNPITVRLAGIIKVHFLFVL